MMQSTWALYNGKWIKTPLEIEVGNRAFLYGDGLFETMRTYATTVLFIKNHVKRLHSGMNMLNLPVISDLQEEKLAANVAGLLNRNKWFSGARVRLTVFRDSEGRFTPQENKTSYVLTGEPLVTEPLYPFAGQGRIMCAYSDYRKPHSFLSSIKSLNSLPYVLAGMYAKQMLCDDSFMINDSDEIIETSNANVILLKDGTAISPGANQGALNGTMRLNIIDLLMKDGWLLEERGILLDELYTADEILLTNAIQGVVWVKGFGEQRFYFENGKAISAKLNRYVDGLLT